MDGQSRQWSHNWLCRLVGYGLVLTSAVSKLSQVRTAPGLRPIICIYSNCGEYNIGFIFGTEIRVPALAYSIQAAQSWYANP